MHGLAFKYSVDILGKLKERQTVGLISLIPILIKGNYCRSSLGHVPAAERRPDTFIGFGGIHTTSPRQSLLSKTWGCEQTPTPARAALCHAVESASIPPLTLTPGFSFFFLSFLSSSPDQIYSRFISPLPSQSRSTAPRA